MDTPWSLVNRVDRNNNTENKVNMGCTNRKRVSTAQPQKDATKHGSLPMHEPNVYKENAKNGQKMLRCVPR